MSVNEAESLGCCGLTCDGVRFAGSHVIYLWTFTGHAAKTGNALTVACISPDHTSGRRPVHFNGWAWPDYASKTNVGAKDTDVSHFGVVRIREREIQPLSDRSSKPLPKEALRI